MFNTTDEWDPPVCSDVIYVTVTTTIALLTIALLDVFLLFLIKKQCFIYCEAYVMSPVMVYRNQ